MQLFVVLVSLTIKLKTMKHTIVLLTFFSFGFVNAQTFIPDPVFGNWLSIHYSAATTDVGGDYYIDELHPSIVNETNLQCINEGISDITGVEAFVNLTTLSCYNNQLTFLPPLPATLQNLFCSYNQLTSLPSLPSGLLQIDCAGNQISSLPALPTGLQYLGCPLNQLTVLPNLPASLTNLNCFGNQLTTLPDLPEDLMILHANDNQITCFPLLPDTLFTIYIHNNPFVCLPNYTGGMDVTTLSYPLCTDDVTTNPYDCQTAFGITGTIYKDVNDDCINSGNNVGYKSLILTDDASGIQTYKTSFSNGVYLFSVPIGDYTVKVNEADLPLGVEVTCPPNDEHQITLSGSNLLSYGNDFGLQCTGFDLGVQAVYVQSGWVFPGEVHNLNIVAGDLSAYFGMNCAVGVGGDISVTIDGLASSVSFGGTPISVSGNTAVYTVTDFEGFLSNIPVQILTDTTAQSGDIFCVTVTITPSILGDLNPNNNTYTFCYNVVNSYDPNIKQTTPQQVAPQYEDEFTYTIYFQNTGNAPAFNIRIEDELDELLDITTFKVVATSHNYTTKIDETSRLLTVKFPNIMLPDSTSNPEGSIGFVQYRIKPVSGLGEGTVIENTAAIFFDFNEPIITNTTQNLFSTLGIEEKALENIIMYPNPASSEVVIYSENKLEKIEIITANGFVCKEEIPASAFQAKMNIEHLSQGIYFVTIYSELGNKTLKLIKK